MHSTRTLATAPSLRAPRSRGADDVFRRVPRVTVARASSSPRSDSCSRETTRSSGTTDAHDDDDDEDAATAATTENANADARCPNGRDADANWWRGGESRRGSGQDAARNALRRWARGIGVEAGVSSERFEVCSVHRWTGIGAGDARGWVRGIG